MWEHLWKHDRSDLMLMLTAWAKRSTVRNSTVRNRAAHIWPLTTIARRVIAKDCDFDNFKGKVELMIAKGVDAKGNRLFEDET